MNVRRCLALHCQTIKEHVAAGLGPLHYWCPQVIEELGLGKVADSKVGDQMIRGVSGGERKRVNIGMELITSPRYLHS